MTTDQTTMATMVVIETIKRHKVVNLSAVLVRKPMFLSCWCRNKKARAYWMPRNKPRQGAGQEVKKASLNFYQVLGLSITQNPSQDEIKVSYRKLCMLHHPDKNLEDSVKAEEMVGHSHLN